MDGAGLDWYQWMYNNTQQTSWTNFYIPYKLDLRHLSLMTHNECYLY